MNKIFLILSLLLININMVNAKPKLGPPSIQLRNNIANIVIVKLERIETDSTLIFTKVEDLHNTAPQNIRLQSKALLANQLDTNQLYIVAYNNFRVSSLTKAATKREKGGIIANIAGAEPAIFRLDSGIKKMFAYSIDESITSPNSMLSIILKGVKNHDPHIQNFFITELFTRKKLLRQLKNEQNKMIIALLEDTQISNHSKEFILSHQQFPKHLFSEQKYRTILLKPLQYLSVNFNSTASDASFVRTCLYQLMPLAKPEDTKVIKRWLYSSSSAVAEMADRVLFKLDRKQEKYLIKQAISSTFLTKNTRSILKKILSKR